MSYLLQYARLPASIGRRSRRARLDEQTTLNRPDFDGGAFVRCYVEDTTARRRHRDARIELEIADCINSARLEFTSIRFEPSMAAMACMPSSTTRVRVRIRLGVSRRRCENSTRLSASRAGKS